MGVFHNLNTTRLITDFLEDEFFVKDVVDMFSSFILQVTKKGGNMYFPTR